MSLRLIGVWKKVVTNQDGTDKGAWTLFFLFLLILTQGYVSLI